MNSLGIAPRAARRSPRPLRIAILFATACLLGTFVGGGSAVSLAADHTLGIGGHHGSPTAVSAARELNLHETGRLHLVSHHNEVLVEQGSGSGTLNGHITVRLTLAYTQAAVSFTAYTSGGTIVGTGEGSTYAEGHVAHFKGTATITGGTGKYAHASAHNIKLRGTLVKKTYTFSVEVEGKMRY
jgi:hypothetical protein